MVLKINDAVTEELIEQYNLEDDIDLKFVPRNNIKFSIPMQEDIGVLRTKTHSVSVTGTGHKEIFVVPDNEVWLLKWCISECTDVGDFTLAYLTMVIPDIVESFVLSLKAGQAKIYFPMYDKDEGGSYTQWYLPPKTSIRAYVDAYTATDPMDSKICYKKYPVNWIKSDD